MSTPTVRRTRKMRFGDALGLPHAGERIGDDLTVGPLIGRGAMGVVFEAYDRGLDRRVALKFVRPEFARTDMMRAQFSREARAMARVRHDNVLAIHSLGELEGIPYFVMEYVDGKTLRDLLDERDGRPLHVDEALGLLAQICRGVQALHTAGVVHRDIKPSNILIDHKFRVVVSDLGLGGIAGGPQLGGSGSVAGTLAYLAPEVLLAEQVPESLHNRPDIYALGVLAFELLVGSLPYRGPDAPWQHVHAPIPRPTERCPDLPIGFDSVLCRALTKDPARRLASADALCNALFSVRGR